MRFLLLIPLLLVGPPPRVPTFTEVADAGGAAGSWITTGVGCCDIDNDGDLDLNECSVNGGSSRVYRNNGDGTFTDISDSGTGGESQSCVFGDIHNDGIPDLYLGWYWSASRMFRGTAAAVPFVDVTGASGTGTGNTWAGVSMADIDNDGDLDLMVSRHGGNALFINNGSGVFSNQAAARGVSDGLNCKGLAFADVDGDGDQDLFSCRPGAARLYLNNGAGVFTDNATAAGVTGATDLYSISWGDIDEDGDLDFFCGGWNGTYLFANNGSGVFTDISSSSGLTGQIGRFGSTFGDYDNDGDLDLFIAGGEIGGGSYTNVLFRNDGGNVFTEVAAAEGVQDTAAVHCGGIFFDYDNDGDLDIYTGRQDSGDGHKNRLYNNGTNGSDWLKVRVVGGFSNWSGYGAKIWVYDEGELGNPANLRGFREVCSTTGECCAPPAEQHFGLPSAANYDVRVTFQGGVTVDLLDQMTNQILTVVEPTSPTVSLVTSSAANGTYGVSAVLPLTVTFSRPVNVTGTPQLTLETGTTDAVLNYVSGSGTNALLFNYTVAAGHASADLDYASTTALALNGGTINHASGTAATLTLPTPGSGNSLAGTKNLVIDSAAPTVTNVTSTTADGSYGPGAAVNVRVVFSENVTVTGTPQLTLETGTADAVLNYASGTGSTTLVFNYTVAAGHASADLDYASTSALTGTIKDAIGNDAVLTLPTPGAANSLGANKALVIDALDPVVVNVTSPDPNGVYFPGDVITVTVEFSEAVTSIGAPRLELETGDVDGNAAYTSGSGTTTLSFTYTVKTGDLTPRLDYQSTTSLNLLGGTLRDAIGNDADTTLPAPGAAGSLGDNKVIQLRARGRDIVLSGSCGSVGADVALVLLPLWIWRRWRRRR